MWATAVSLSSGVPWPHCSLPCGPVLGQQLGALTILVLREQSPRCMERKPPPGPKGALLCLSLTPELGAPAARPVQSPTQPPDLLSWARGLAVTD